jgi:hypothetical protein
MNLAAMANGGGGVLKRKALVLKNDPEGSGKYIAGLSDVRVKTRQVSPLSLNLHRISKLMCRKH